jgi:Spy/CpxP family protein refolding chaperone
MSKNLSGAAIATAAALLFSVAAVSTATADEAKMHCDGANACKGQSACKTAHNACKGQNSCKGTGFVEMSKKDCDAAKAAKK